MTKIEKFDLDGKAMVRVEMSAEEWADMNDEVLLMNCLRNGGVDNWEWWDEAITEYHAAKEADKTP